MSDTRLTKLEEQLSHQHNVTEELNTVVTAQAKQIDVMERRIALLMLRAAESEADTLSGAPITDQKPPHW